MRETGKISTYDPMIDRPEEGQKDEYLEKLKVLVTTYALLEARELANAEE